MGRIDNVVKLAAVLLTFAILLPVFAYEGYDPLPTGGEGGDTIWVTNLNDSGSGSFRDALASLDGSPTIIKFSTNGTINIQSPLVLSDSNVTIDGASAPGAGITVDGGGNYRTFEIVHSKNAIVRHMRFRNASIEGIQLTGWNNFIIDHCSITGCGDGALDINGEIHHVTVSNCLFADNVEVHRAYGINTSLHHNLYTYNNRRQPKIYLAGPEFDFRNNVVHCFS